MNLGIIFLESYYIMEILTVYWIKILATLVVFAVLLVLFFKQSATIKDGRDVGSELEKLGEPIRY